jgi:hypothetical protein
MRVVKETSPYLRSKYNKNRNRALASVLIGSLSLGFGIYFDNYPPSPLYIILGTMICIGSIPFIKGALSFRSGMQGEKVVVKALHVLDDSYHLLNDILIRGVEGNIDHILVSPKGIFIIETKNNSNEIKAYKAKRKISEELTKKARFLSHLIKMTANLTIFVKPICVFTHPKLELKLPNLDPNIEVLHISRLTRHIIEAKSPKNFADSQLELIFKIIIEEDKNTQIKMAKKKDPKHLE